MRNRQFRDSLSCRFAENPLSVATYDWVLPWLLYTYTYIFSLHFVSQRCNVHTLSLITVYRHARFFHSTLTSPIAWLEATCRVPIISHHPTSRERRLNEIARSRYRVKENKKKRNQGGKVLTKWRARGTRNAKRGHRRGEICNRDSVS